MFSFSHRYLVVFMVVLLFVPGCGKKTSTSKPNIILISIDTLRADFLGCHGYPRPTSPTLDKLASKGVLFEDASSPSPWTLPAHVSLLSGLYPSRHSVKDVQTKISTDIPTLASILSRHGYATAAIVNSLLLDEKFGFGRGFDHYSRIPETGDAVGCSPAIAAEAMDWLLKNRNQQFFLFLHYYDVHSDYSSLPRYEDQFVGPYFGMADGTTNQLLQFRKGHVKLNENDVKHLTDLYAASIRQLDDELEKFFSFLRKRKMLDNTLIVVTSDHGEEFLEHGGVLHGRTQFQELIHVPLIFQGLNLPRGRRVEHMVSLVDVFPTVLALAGVGVPSAIDGVDLSPLWRERGFEPPMRFIFAEADHNNKKDDIKRAIRQQRYKLHYDILTDKTQLYDLSEDPGEKVNIISEHGDLSKLLFKRLKDFMSDEKAGQSREVLAPEEIQKLKALGYLQ
ncbi:MAG: sulfatase [Planctomycetes bacterium]|nr:sulfatase [Planctomycetota bacterium]